MKPRTIVAPATALMAQPLGIVRLSGPDSLLIAKKISGLDALKPRHAYFTVLKDQSVIDHAVLIYFKAPYSFTGEDVVEFQLHGNPYVLERVINFCLSLGAVAAKGGEFSERAFLNGKMSLDQVEAVADLIHANSERAARSAAVSLGGALGDRVLQIQQDMMALRVLVEANIDFSDEDIPSIAMTEITQGLGDIHLKLDRLIQQAKQGVQLSSGLKVTLLGAPNAGKSTLMNQICQYDVSIVTHEAGTTRDVVSKDVVYNGVSLSFSDTAGIRETESLAEKLGIERSHTEASESDLVLYISEGDNVDLSHYSVPVWRIRNKCDLLSEREGFDHYISAKTGEGVDELLKHILAFFSLNEQADTPFSARTRQVDVLKRAHKEIENIQDMAALELIAQGLMHAQDILSEITGEVTTDDVLGQIFSSFCIGK